MGAEKSEQLFEGYLKQHGLKYQRHFLVNENNPNSANVDFRIKSNANTVLCDVKEIKKPHQNIEGELGAYHNIRKDIKKLREKFRKNRPKEPCVLVSMNFSSVFFTGFTVVKAMLGDIGVEFDKQTKQIISHIHHLPRGNAAMTKHQNRSISGVLVFERSNNNHYLFTNPFADNPVPKGFFPEVKIVHISKGSINSTLSKLSKIMFF